MLLSPPQVTPRHILTADGWERVDSHFRAWLKYSMPVKYSATAASYLPGSVEPDCVTCVSIPVASLIFAIPFCINWELPIPLEPEAALRDGGTSDGAARGTTGAGAGAVTPRKVSTLVMYVAICALIRSAFCVLSPAYPEAGKGDPCGQRARRRHSLRGASVSPA
jgi:hypothetical protein